MHKKKKFNDYICKVGVISLFLTLAGCSDNKDDNTNNNDNSNDNTSSLTIKDESFGTTPSGEKITKYTLRNSKGIEVEIINYGGMITSLKVPDREGVFEDVVLGFDDLQGYIDNTSYIGALIGRYGNRIAKGQFSLNDVDYQLEINNGVNHLHGGLKGFNKQVWKSESFTENDEVGVKLTLVSPDGAGGYPGTLSTTAIYTLDDDDQLSLKFEAETDKATPVNLTGHSYFNLAVNGTITNHKLKINAQNYTPVDATLIPTGEIAEVKGTPFDFRETKEIGLNINDKNQQLVYGLGYDHNFVLDDYKAGTVRTIATLSDPHSGRIMEILSDQPGLQFYSGNFLDGTTIGKDSTQYQYREGLCLEPQFFPDSPNKANFPSTILEPGTTYSNQIVYRFSVME
ncbi:aldose epimerase family protein [Shewanella gaetbuli]|uniref:Aldose 1-epimerase n=1 Tax=Shewanella gaetbuli TaxID=220752 RepID=A0A9X1ZJ24_9GAMM|nr:aldose epimerase family protein [Shewanella gaetbuli]MCL1142643.1 galactose mutarotase [Shewanella gaetbuli]